MPDRAQLASGPAANPDQQWLARVRAALEAWERTPAARPTSSVLGGGAIAAAEARFSALHDDRPALLLPSATYALRVALQVVGVGLADEVLCPVLDWPSSLAAVTSLGAVPVCVAVDPATLTIDPLAAAAAATSRTRAVIACHLHGVCADVPALRAAVPRAVVIEDAAQAFGSALDDRQAGTLGDLAVLSLGPGKHLDAGEGGVLLCADSRFHEAAVALACHPLRHLLAGVRDAPLDTLAMRPHPMTAILALHALDAWFPEATARAQAAVRDAVTAVPGVRALGDPLRHRTAGGAVPVLLDDPEAPLPPGVSWSGTGAQVLPGASVGSRKAAVVLASRARLAIVARPHRGLRCRSPRMAMSSMVSNT
jgi:hypothetical protein